VSFNSTIKAIAARTLFCIDTYKKVIEDVPKILVMAYIFINRNFLALICHSVNPKVCGHLSDSL
jgi:hypothetical protein